MTRPRALCWAAVTCLLGLVSCQAAAGDQQISFSPTESIQFTKGDYLEDLPGFNKLQPGKRDGLSSGLDMDISIVAAHIEGPVNTPQRNFSFFAYAFKDNSDGTTFLHGPLLTLAAGETHHVLLTNELTLTPGEAAVVPEALYEETFNYYRLPTHSNLHLHGLWAYSGVPDLSSEYVPYIGMGDNVYYDMPPKLTANSMPAYLKYAYVLEHMHLPGTHWYHPHFHGSSSLQEQSASGPILVTSNVKYLTAERGCAPLLALLEAALTRVIYLQAFMFQDADLAGAPYNIFDIPGYDQISNAHTPPYVAYPNNPLCCSVKRTGYGFHADRVNVALVNGGLQPVVRMTPKVPQRWQIWNADWKGYVDLNIITVDGMLAPCEFHLLTKDGVYLMQTPRLVTDLVLAVANRAEVIVVCDGIIGHRYYLSSGLFENFGPTYPYDSDADRFIQSNILEIELVDSPEDGKVHALAAKAAMELVKNKGCMPKRPSYVADLRGYQLQGNLTLDDASGNTTLKEIYLTEVNPYGCEINGRNFSYPTQNPIVLPLGQVLELHYTNQANHPTHLHDHPQQITNLNLTAIQPGTSLPNFFEVGDWQDTFKLPQLEAYDTNTENILTTRAQPGPFSGYTVLHCHFLHHQDVGCMSVVQKPCPYNNYPGPNATIPYPCPGGFQFPVTGDFGVEDYLGTANLPLKESIAEAGAAVHSAKCNAALTGMLPCDEQLLV